jgi:hypothetical protein
MRIIMNLRKINVGQIRCIFENKFQEQKIDTFSNEDMNEENI